MPRAGWLLLLALAGCQSVSAEKPPADPPTGERDADAPKAAGSGSTPARVELTPNRADLAPGKEVLLIASVFDAAGDPRRNRRVEWALTGPGEIVGVAGDGWFGRGRRTKSSAVSYTGLSDTSAKRGDGASATVRAGQAWCRVKGGDADTVVTATVPDIPESSRRAATATLSPGDRVEPPSKPKPRDPDPDDEEPAREVPDRPRRDRDAAPTGRSARPPELALDVVAPPGVGVGQTAVVVLTTSNKGGGAAPAVNLLARLPDGLELVSSDPPPAVRQGPDERDLRWELGELAAGATADRVTLTVRPTRRGEHRVQAAAEDRDGQRDDRDVPVTADDSSLAVTLDVPPTVAVGDTVPVTVVVTNTGGVAVRNAVAFVTAGAELAPDLVPREVPVGVVAPGDTKRVTARLTAARAGRPTVRANVTADGGLAEAGRAEVIITDRPEPKPRADGPADKPSDRPERPKPAEAKPKPAGRPMLTLEIVDLPATLTAGGKKRVLVKVRNKGTGVARGVEVTAAAEGSLSAAGGLDANKKRAAADGNRVRFGTLAELPPGTAVFELDLDAGPPGSGRVSATVRAEHLSKSLRDECDARVVEK